MYVYSIRRKHYKVNLVFKVSSAFSSTVRNIDWAAVIDFDVPSHKLTES